VEKCKSEFFLVKNRESEPICVLETGRACLKENLVNSVLESLPDYSVKFPCYTVGVDGTSPASSTFRVNKVMPRRSAVGIFTPRAFLRRLVGVVYSAEKITA
jgi:2-C-methyl-D-erythritol 4-phosphate cytidylyltransferase